MPIALASSVGLDGLLMANYSPITNVLASPKIRTPANACFAQILQNTNMDDDDRNGGPNHLRAWMRYRRKKGADLAAFLDTTPSVVSELMSSKTQLSAKWLRRIAPFLKTTPGHLLDHDPNDLPSDVIEIWAHATNDQRRKILDVAKIITTGTDG